MYMLLQQLLQVLLAKKNTYLYVSESNCKLISEVSTTAGKGGWAPRGSKGYCPPTISYEIMQAGPGDLVEAINARHSVCPNCEHTTTEHSNATVKELSTCQAPDFLPYLFDTELVPH